MLLPLRECQNQRKGVQAPLLDWVKSSGPPLDLSIPNHHTSAQMPWTRRREIGRCTIELASDIYVDFRDIFPWDINISKFVLHSFSPHFFTISFDLFWLLLLDGCLVFFLSSQRNYRFYRVLNLIAFDEVIDCINLWIVFIRNYMTFVRTWQIWQTITDISYGWEKRASGKLLQFARADRHIRFRATLPLYLSLFFFFYLHHNTQTKVYAVFRR